MAGRWDCAYWLRTEPQALVVESPFLPMQELCRGGKMETGLKIRIIVKKAGGGGGGVDIGETMPCFPVLSRT